MALKDVKSRIGSIKNIQKITRAMEMMSAARLRRAEQRISVLRPYAGAIRRMTRQAADAAGSVPSVPILAQRENEEKVALVLITADRGLAGAFNSQIIRAGVRRARELENEGKQVVWYATGRRGVSSLTFRGHEVAGSYTGFTERPAYSDAREVASDLMAAYVDGDVDRVEVIYNGYVSALTQKLTQEVLLPLQEATILGEGEEEGDGDEGRRDGDGDGDGDGEAHDDGHHALVEYEPEPEEILQRLVPAYVEISLYRALLESAAAELGARMTAMRNASENAGDLIKEYTLQMNRERQAAITQEIMEVVAGAESLT
ncbi:MAG: F-type H+-transporting ATPase subunit gamma [Solirubrobacteraceae bacterium]|nr:F-type H+-transporting ATPase subunit gamma [Solirubrobacteraceae bacterium]